MVFCGCVIRVDRGGGGPWWGEYRGRGIEKEEGYQKGQEDRGQIKEEKSGVGLGEKGFAMVG